MASATMLASTVHYIGQNGIAVWEGRYVDDPKRFNDYVKGVVRLRVADQESSFDADIRGLASTGMATQFVEKLLKAVPRSLGWEIGEALAECVLQHDCNREVHWPWNTVRDRRTPRASLPGADLVGFYQNGDTVHLLFGEVKTSSDAGSPPNVMTGPSGMNWQLEESATNLSVQHSILKWLHARCQSLPYRGLFEKAVERYLQSQGKEILLIGVLIRDTPPNERDVKSRAQALAKKLTSPTRIELLTWYLPTPIDHWPTLLSEEAP